MNRTKKLATTKKRLQKKTRPDRQQLPSREDILAYIAEHPGEAGKREIARHFGIKGAARIPLKALLKELTGQRAIDGGKRRLAASRSGRRPSSPLERTGDIASVSVLFNCAAKHADSILSGVFCCAIEEHVHRGHVTID
jgi:ribonuclease R